MDLSARKPNHPTSLSRKQHSLALILCHHNEFRAAFQQFLQIQKENLFNERSWGNVGSAFLGAFLWNAPVLSKRIDNNSQFMSQSLFNSNRDNAAQGQENERIKKSRFLTELNVGQSARSDDEWVLAEVACSAEFLDFLKQKENQDNCKMALSCLKRFAFSQFEICIHIYTRLL